MKTFGKLTIILLFTAFWANAAAGDLDASFGASGIIQTNFGGDDPANDIAVQTDGKIIVVGYTQPGSGTSRDTAIARYNTDGSLDTTFDADGKLTLDIGNGITDSASAVVIQPDGKILIAGNFININNSLDEIYILRLNADGTFDTTFNGTGVSTAGIGSGGSFAAELTLQSDGKAVVVGNAAGDGFDFAVLRFAANGALDTNFDGDGKVLTGFQSGSQEDTSAVKIQTDGKIVVAGTTNIEFSSIALARYNTDGSLDAGFSGDGKQVWKAIGGIPGSYLSDAKDLAIQADGKIVTAGSAVIGLSYTFMLARFNTDGSPDYNFRGTNFETEVYENDACVLVDVAGWAESASELRIQPNGKIVAAGYTGEGNLLDFAAIRLNPNGTSDGSFSGDGEVSTQISTSLNDIASAVAIQADGKIVAAGSVNESDTSRNFAVARYLGSNFNPNSADFDGDGRADYAVFRPSSGVWFNLNSTNNSFNALQWGIGTDAVVSDDYTGDGKAERGVFRGGVWYLYLSGANSNPTIFQFGQTGDIAVPADYDGDLKADFAVFRPSNGIWYILQSSNAQVRYANFGLAGDKPVRGDFDGDGRADIAVFRSGVWYILRSSDNGVSYVNFGLAGDKTAAGDYDGDGKTDVCVFRNGVWYILRSSDGAVNYVQFGLSSDKLVPADFDGDGKVDVAVYRNGLWIIQKSSGGTDYVQFGLAEDTPVQTALL